MYECEANVPNIRNLYIMMFASDYSVETFLRKLKDGEFGEEFIVQQHTPEKFRSDVYAIGK